MIKKQDLSICAQAGCIKKSVAYQKAWSKISFRLILKKSSSRKPVMNLASKQKTKHY